jgi:hypothetical protein
MGTLTTISTQISSMKNVLLAALFTGLSCALVDQTATPAAAQLGQQSPASFSPTVSFENGNTLWSLENRAILSDALSLRTIASFASSDPNGNKYGTSLNYSFNLDDEAKTFSPFAGIGVAYYSGASSQLTGFAQAGIDLQFDGLTLTGSLAVPFNGERGITTSIGLGLKF